MYPYDLQSTPICREAMPSSVYAAAPSLSRLDVPTCYSSTSLNIPSSLHLHPSTWCWINIPNNTCSGPGSPCSKLQPSVDFRKEVQTPQLGITKLLWSAPNTSTTPLECQVMADVLVSSKALTFPPPTSAQIPPSTGKGCFLHSNTLEKMLSRCEKNK